MARLPHFAAEPGRWPCSGFFGDAVPLRTAWIETSPTVPGMAVGAARLSAIFLPPCVTGAGLTRASSSVRLAYGPRSHGRPTDSTLPYRVDDDVPHCPNHDAARPGAQPIDLQGRTSSVSAYGRSPRHPAYLFGHCPRLVIAYIWTVTAVGSRPRFLTRAVS